MIARNKLAVCIEAGPNSGSTAQSCRNVVRVHVSYRAFLRAGAFRPCVCEKIERILAQSFLSPQDKVSEYDRVSAIKAALKTLAAFEAILTTGTSETS